MRILIAGNGQFEWFAPAWAKALLRLGMDVHFFDFGNLYSPGLLGRIESHFMLGPGISRINAELIRMVDEIKPKIVLIHNGNPFRAETIIRLRQRCWVSGYHHDDPFGAFGDKAYFRLFRRAIPFYNSHHVVREENLLEYQQLGVNKVKVLMRYYVPWLHYPCWSKLKEACGSNLDVVFIGHAERDRRIQYVTKLVEAGIPLRIFGSPKYWRRYLPKVVRKRLPVIKPVVGDDYVHTIWSAKICLAFYSSGNRDRYAYRVFEIPACGGFLLAERTNVMQSLYEEGKEAEYFSSSEELIDKIRFYLRHEEARQRIAKQGYERCIRSGYDIVSRMKQWLADVWEFWRT